jgi:hypothetical protein
MKFAGREPPAMRAARSDLVVDDPLKLVNTPLPGERYRERIAENCGRYCSCRSATSGSTRVARRAGK